MRYGNIKKARFISRPNRFIAYCETDGVIKTVHVKNTGRCRELLTQNTVVYLCKSDNPARKTEYDLVSVEKGTKLINMDSQLPNGLCEEWLPKSGIFSGNAKIRREVTFENSRFDIFVEDGARRAFMEVKGVTLEKDGAVFFPDAPTERGVKHINELIRAKNMGYEAYLVFVIQMSGVKYFSPNDETHRAFGDALRKANSCGVNILALSCDVSPDSVIIAEKVSVKL